MASNCFTPIRGRRMRVTKVDSLGRPVPGICSQVVTSGFVNVEMTAEIEEGETTTVRTAGGDICVSERGCDQLNWYNISIEFCQVDPDLFAMINPTWTKLTGYKGDTIGWEESHSYSCDAGFALEVWSDVTGYAPTDPNAEGAWVYYLLPFVVGGTLGDLTIENGAVTFTLTGRTKRGSQWGRGPYNVMANPPDGTCGPLITPFSPEAPRRIFLTTCRPPEPVCGCQPLSAANGPATVVTEDTTDVTRMSAVAYVTGVGPFTVDWGDGTVEDLPEGVTGKTHKYGAEGDYVVSIYPTSDKARATYSTIHVPFTGTTPDQPLIAAVSEDTADATRNTANAEWNNFTFGTIRIDWGDGNVTLAQPATGTATHPYAAPGTYTVIFTDESDSTRTFSQTITVPFGPTMTITRDPSDGVDRRSVIVRVNNYGEGSVTINWGDGSATTTNPGDGVGASTHKFATAGTKTITATDVDDPTRVVVGTVVVPFPELPPLLASAQETEPRTADRRTVTVTWNNQGQGPVTINWGDTQTDTGADAATATHAYATGGNYTITVASQNDPSGRTAPVPVTVPFTVVAPLTVSVGEVSPQDAGRRKVIIAWDNHGEGQVNVNPGEGAAVNAQPDKGTLEHTYTGDQAYTVTVTDATDGTRTGTAQVTTPFVSHLPAFLAVPGGTGQSVVVEMINAGVGKTYEVQWEAAGPWEKLPATGTQTIGHVYAAAGAKDIRVRDAADTSLVSAVTTVTLPWAATFFAAVAEPEGAPEAEGSPEAATDTEAADKSTRKRRS